MSLSLRDNEVTEKKRGPRLLSLDVFRGITIAGMILVNTPGNATSYAWLQHAVWHGCNLADLVFPFFIFILGVSVVFSSPYESSLDAAQRNQGSHLQHFHKILKRTLIIFSIGLFLNAFPNHFSFDAIRVFGVLQRIAICYFFAATLCLTTQVRTQAFIIVGILIGYWLLMAFMPVPGYGSGQFTPEGNFAAYIDRLIFSSAHLYGKVFDPEGMLSTLPAIATALLGNLTGHWLRTNQPAPIKLRGLLLAGVLCLLAGWAWGSFFPINKALWTSAYVLWTAGLALLLLGFCYGTIEIKQWKSWSRPFEVFGVNAILAYTLHVLFFKIQLMIKISTQAGTTENLRAFLTEHLFGWASLPNASLLYALTGVLFWWVVMWLLYQKRIFIKV
jgi:predicted acyltransferase